MSWVVGAAHLGGFVDFVPKVLDIHEGMGHGGDHVVQVVGFQGRYIRKIVFGHEVRYVEG